MTVHWKHHVEAHDYTAANNYLSLVAGPDTAERWTESLQHVEQITAHPAKDVLRASGLPLLPPDNAHVQKDLHKIRDGEHLSPVLLIAGRLGKHPLIIADGYHRVCAAYHTDENTDVPAHIF